MTIDLQSGQPYWLLTNRNLPRFLELEKDESADVVILGAGVSGALTAALLAEAGFNVIVLDRRTLGCGSTGASTALLCYEPDRSFAELIELRGPCVAVRSYGIARSANQQLGEVIQRLEISCGYRNASSIHFARSKEQATELREEFDHRIGAGFPCEYLTSDQLSQQFGLVGRAALTTPEAAQLDPVRLTVGLLKYAVQCGARCFMAQARHVEPGPIRQVVTTQHGPTVSAGHVVVATGYETQQLLKQPTVRLASTYAIATSVTGPMPAWFERSVLWDLDDPYHYLRSTMDGRILVGGEDDPFLDEAKRDARMPEKARSLQRYLSEILPDLRTELFSQWCGTFAVSDDGLPYIGEHPGMLGSHFVLSYGGNGTTFAMVGAQYVLDTLQGRANDDAPLFSFERDIPTSVSPPHPA